MASSRIDWVTFVTCLALIVVSCTYLAWDPESSGALLQSTYDYIAREFGIVYLLASVSVIGFLVWLAAGRFGRVRLSSGDEKPEFSTLSWVAMLFCAGVGAGLLYWCAVEWAYYYESPPFGAAPRSPAAAEWASTYGMYHWGLTAWAFYCLPTIAIAYPYYRKNLNYLRFSLSCNYFLTGREQGALARGIDLLFMIAMIGGAATSLGFTAPMIAALIARLLDMEPGFGLQVAVMLLCASLFATSVWLGLRKGIRTLSDINLVLALALLVYILIVGPTAFLLKTSLNSVGLMATNFLRMNFWTDPFTESGFVEDWTVFYWAWWIAYGPYMGLFVTRISHGRSIREVVVGMTVFGSLGCWLFYMVIGNYSLYLELEGLANITSILKSSGHSAAIVATFDELPFAPAFIAVFSVIAIIFAATTYDSASYTLASGATLDLRIGDEPARWHRVFWAFALGLLPIALIFIGGLKIMQVSLLIVSAPILIVGVIMSVALVKSLRAAGVEPVSGQS